STATQGNQSYIEIQPASTDVVYVPQYNPVAVWGPPPEYYPYPAMYYPPVSGGAIFAASAISFGVGMAIGSIWCGGSLGRLGVGLRMGSPQCGDQQQLHPKQPLQSRECRKRQCLDSQSGSSRRRAVCQPQCGQPLRWRGKQRGHPAYC